MKPFSYETARDVDSAVDAVARDPEAQFIAGGTSQVDLMKEGVQQPTRLVDISRLPLYAVEPTAPGGLRVGANVKNSVAAGHPRLAPTYPAISEAIHAGASQQIRNVASMAGNVLQRTRCPYLRDPAQSCNKRDPGSGCAAVDGFNRMHAIFGQADDGASSPHTCIAAHPSDMAVALAAHEAVLMVTGPDGSRQMAFEDLHQEPRMGPERDTTLEHGELINAIVLPPFSGGSHYLKVRDRASYAYALVSCAVTLSVEGGRITRARIALGSVAPGPWRARAAESLLEGQEPGEELFREAAARAVDGARTYSMNAYKPRLASAVVERGLLEVAGMQPLAGPPGTALAASVGGIAGAGVPA